MSEIENTEVGNTEPAQRTGSSAEPVSFDEMESIMSQKPEAAQGGSKLDRQLGAKPKAKPDAAKPKPKPEAKAKPEAADPAEGAEEPDSPEAEERQADEAAKQGAKTQAKAFKGRAGDQELDIPADMVVPVKVNGKLENVAMQDLVNEFSGKTNWSRRFQELDTERKSFESERTELQSSIDDLFNLAVTENKPLEAVAYLADLLGGDGMKTVQSLQQQMLSKFEELSRLTPEEKRALQAEERAALTEAKYKNQESARARRSEQESVAKRVDEVKTKYGMTDERFRDLYDNLKRNGTKPEDLTPEFIGQVHQRWLQMDDVDAIVEANGYTENALQVKQALLDEWTRDPSLTRAQVEEIAAAVFGGKVQAKAGSKLKQKMERNAGGPAHQRRPAASSSKRDALTFDDLD